MRPLTLFTGQWADLPFADLAPKIAELGYDGLELACWGDHFDVQRALSEDDYCQTRRQALAAEGLDCWAISNHLVGQAVCDRIDERHESILPPHVWGDGEPEGVRQRAAQELIDTARAAKKFGVSVVNGFTGSNIWHLCYSFPPVLPGQIAAGFADFGQRFRPVLDAFESNGIRFALEVHPGEIAFDITSAEQALEAVDRHPAFGFNFDPSHFVYQGVDAIEFIRRFGNPDGKYGNRIFHCHIKDAWFSEKPMLAGVFGGHVDFGDSRRFWNFRSPGRGSVDFEEVIRALNEIGYSGPLSVEWEDAGMDRFHGAAEAHDLVRSLDFPPSKVVFDEQFARAKQPK